MEQISIIYLLIVNVISFIAIGIDKNRARNKKWRIPEKQLWLLALIGGSIGSIIGMRSFRHKTKHRSFLIGMPTVLLFQIAIISFLIIK